MSEQLKFSLTKETIHLSFDGKYISIPSSDKRFNEIKGIIHQVDNDKLSQNDGLEMIRETFDRKLKTVEEYILGSGLTLVNGRLRDQSGEELPEVLSERMMALKEEGFSVDRLVKFWENLKQNPSMRSREQLYSFLMQNGHPLTDDGCFIAYRGIKANFTDMHTGKMDNSPGKVVTMPREQVDDDPTRTCSRGLHVAAFEYAKNFGNITVEVKVNPRDVVAVPTDYNGQKMRTCQFEVIQVCEAMNTDVVYGMSYAQSQLEWEDDSPKFEDWEVEMVTDLAGEFKERYGSDRLVLATRIEEEINGPMSESELSVSDVLEILNENEEMWLDSDEECDNGGCDYCSCDD